MVAPNRQFAVTANLTNTTETTLRAAPSGAGIRQYWTQLVLQNKNATAAVLTIRNGTAGTSLFVVSLPASMASPIVVPVLLPAGVNTLISGQLSAAGDVLINVQGFDGT